MAKVASFSALGNLPRQFQGVPHKDANSRLFQLSTYLRCVRADLAKVNTDSVYVQVDRHGVDLGLVCI
jgi:hypothetical protein